MSALYRGLLSFAADKRGLSKLEYGLFAALIVGAILLGEAIVKNS